ncbi:MAG: GntR family transcriptional regulator [Anaerocolumna sp.]|jgi:DNA-binding GntR family transcriptional regulator|nr:GntR family transcriptional regulator [Anaerocolumna sp.]
MSNSLKQQAYNVIRSKILTCEYAPNTYLNEDLLCRELNVSRTPIRDALSRLEQENLVKIIPKKGVIVAPLTINEINMIYETRILLEPYILKTYGRRINDSIEKRMHEILEKANNNTNDIQMLYELDDEYHHIIIDLCENKYLIQCYLNIYAQNLRLRIISGNQNKERLEASQQEHMNISKYILKRDYDNAAKAMEVHLLASKDAAFKVILLDGNISI